MQMCVSVNAGEMPKTTEGAQALYDEWATSYDDNLKRLDVFDIF